jgi:hypothetical protein
LWFGNDIRTGGTGTFVTSTETSGDPLFDTDSYHILPGSAAENAGVIVVDEDIDAQPRPFNSGYDLGADELVVNSVSIPPLVGGTLVYVDASGMTTTVQVPPGTVPGSSYDLVYISRPDPSPLPSPGYHSVGHSFVLQAYRSGILQPGYVFDPPATVEMYYKDEDILGVQENDLRLAYWDGSAWADANSTCTPASTYTRDLIKNSCYALSSA